MRVLYVFLFVELISNIFMIFFDYRASSASSALLVLSLAATLPSARPARPTLMLYAISLISTVVASRSFMEVMMHLGPTRHCRLLAMWP